MAVTPVVVDTGSTTPTVGTGFSTLNSGSSPRTTDMVIVIRVDISAMLDGDAMQISLAEEVQNDAGTQRETIIFEAANAQGDNDWWHSEAFIVANGWDVKLRQLTGTARAYPWSIWQA
jgi:hypothetical protein